MGKAQTSTQINATPTLTNIGNTTQWLLAVTYMHSKS